MSDPRPSTPSHAPGRGADPPIDERIVMPESRAEILHGELLWSAPAEPPHATAHCGLAYVLQAHVGDGYRAAVDLLTRTGHDSDFAPDASVFPASAESEPRRLEELAFEVTSEQALSVPTSKARELIRRGVRRVFALLVKQQRALEWDRASDGWSPLPHDAVIADRCLVRPLPIAALLHAAAQDDAVARALVAKGNRVIGEVVESAADRARCEGRVAMLRENLRDAAYSFGLEITAAREAALVTMTESELRAVYAQLLRDRRWE